MTPKQQRFCEEYLIDCNGTQAAIRAGYSEATACETASRLLANVKVRAYIDELLDSMRDESIATAENVLQYLTQVMRGKTESEIVVTLGTGDGITEAVKMNKKPSEPDRLKAAELLGKRYGLFSQKVEMEVNPVVIRGYDDVPD